MSTATKRHTILVVDDSEPIRRILGLLYEGHGWDAVLAANGAIAREMIELGRPDLVSLDLSLPDVDGRQLLGEIAAQGIPVVVVSAYACTLIPEERALAVGVVSKPFDVDELLSVVGRQLDAVPHV